MWDRDRERKFLWHKWIDWFKCKNSQKNSVYKEYFFHLQKLKYFSTLRSLFVKLILTFCERLACLKTIHSFIRKVRRCYLHGGNKRNLWCLNCNLRQFKIGEKFDKLTFRLGKLEALHVVTLKHDLRWSRPLHACSKSWRAVVLHVVMREVKKIKLQ